MYVFIYINIYVYVEPGMIWLQNLHSTIINHVTVAHRQN